MVRKMAVKIDGTDELIKALDGMSKNIKNKVTRQAVQKGAEVILREQKKETSQIGLSNSTLEVEKSKSGGGSVKYDIGLGRGGKHFSDPSSPYFDEVRGLTT